MKKVSIIVPCYNEEANVNRFFDEVNRVFKNQVEDFEFVFVNDGSKDGTYSKLKSLYNENNLSDIQVLTFSRNFPAKDLVLLVL